MPDMEKKFLAFVEEVDIDAEGRVMVAESDLPSAEAAREEVKIVYVDRFIEKAEEEKPAVVAAAPQEELAAAEEPENEPIEELAFKEQDVADIEVGEDGAIIRYNKSFEAKLIQTQLPNQDFYTELKNELLSYKGVKSRISWNFDTFNKGRKKCARLAIRGKTLIIYLALDPKDEEAFPQTKYHQFDVSDVARFADYPFGMKIKSARAVKHAKELIAIVMLGVEAKHFEMLPQDYHYPYETTAALIERGLIKVGGESTGYKGESSQGVSVPKELPAPEAIEEPVEEVAAEPAAEEQAFEAEPVEEETAAADAAAVAPIEALDEPAKQKYVNKSFAQKMLLADEILQDRYDELKNYALRFKKLKARISKKFDSINKGRLQFVKLSVAGKTLKLFLNMDINETEPKFHCKDMRDKKTYEPVPVLLRIKSGRAVKYAKILIDQCAAGHGLVENKKFQEVDAIALVEEAVQAKNNK